MGGVGRVGRHSLLEAQAEHASVASVFELPPFLESTNPAMMRAISMARQAAASDVTVLLVGERGTGKKTLARAIHGWSRRRTRRLVTVSQATIAKQFWATLAAQLLADRRGNDDQDLEAVDGGTLFFDEVSDLSVETQGQLLRFFDERRFWWVAQSHGEARQIDARLIAASSRDLETCVQAGRFRVDLFYRLNALTIAVPPLRDRCEDLAKLIDHVSRRSPFDINVLP